MLSELRGVRAVARRRRRRESARAGGRRRFPVSQHFRAAYVGRRRRQPGGPADFAGRGAAAAPRRDVYLDDARGGRVGTDDEAPPGEAFGQIWRARGRAAFRAGAFGSRERLLRPDTSPPVVEPRSAVGHAHLRLLIEYCPSRARRLAPRPRPAVDATLWWSVLLDQAASAR